MITRNCFEIKAFISGKAVYFFALLSVTLNNMPQGSTIVFDKAITNKGGAYNTTSGEFTASVAGAYVFSWTVLSIDRRFINAYLFHNEKYIAVAQADTLESNDASSGSNTVVLDLIAGDTVRVAVGFSSDMSARQVYAEGTSTFSGWLISN